jgi:hypothetical protein
MRKYFGISLAVHVGGILFLIIFNQFSYLFRSAPPESNVVPVTFVERIPDKKALPTQRVPLDAPVPKEQKEVSPPPKPAPAMKTKVEESHEVLPPEPSTPAELPQAVKPVQEQVDVSPVKTKAKKAIKKPDKKPKPKKTNSPKKKEKAKKAKPEPASKGKVKKKQEVESIDALLTTLVPDVGGKKKEEVAPSIEEEDVNMPPDLEDLAVQEIRSQIEAVWSFNPTEGISFILRIQLDPAGKILKIELSGTEGQTPQQRAAAEAAYRATLKLGHFEVRSDVFKQEYHSNVWGEVEVHFHPDD